MMKNKNDDNVFNRFMIHIIKINDYKEDHKIFFHKLYKHL